MEDKRSETVLYDDDKLKKLAENNNKVFKSLNYWISLEFNFGRPAFKNIRVSLYVGLIRFVYFLILLLRMFVALIFDDCLYSELRYWLLDWTVLYPANRRKPVARSMLNPSFGHVVLKSSLFLSAPLKPSLQDDLTEYPQLEKSPTVKQEKFAPSGLYTYKEYLTRVKLLHTTSEPTLPIKSRIVDEKDSFFVRLLREVDRLFMKLIPECNKFKDSTRTNSNQVLRRDREHWLSLSRSLAEFYSRGRKVILVVVCAQFFYTLYQFVFELKEDEQNCFHHTTMLKIVGIVERLFMDIERLLANHAGVGHVYIVNKDLKYKLTRVNGMIDQLVDYHENRGAVEIFMNDKIEGNKNSFNRNLMMRPNKDKVNEFTQDLQAKVNDYYHSLDRDSGSIKRILSVIGITLIFNMSIPFTLRGAEGGSLAMTEYLKSVLLPLIISVYLCYLCADLYNQSMKLGTRILLLCSRNPQDENVEGWNKILNIWFKEKSCAFSILGIMKITHMNIIQSVTYIISGILWVMKSYIL